MILTQIYILKIKIKNYEIVKLKGAFTCWLIMERGSLTPTIFQEGPPKGSM